MNEMYIWNTCINIKNAYYIPIKPFFYNDQLYYGFSELHKTLKDSSGRKKAVHQSLERLCQINNFVSYTFSPPKMIKACNYIVGMYFITNNNK